MRSGDPLRPVSKSTRGVVCLAGGELKSTRFGDFALVAATGCELFTGWGEGERRPEAGRGTDIIWAGKISRVPVPACFQGIGIGLILLKLSGMVVVHTAFKSPQPTSHLHSAIDCLPDRCWTRKLCQKPTRGALHSNLWLCNRGNTSSLQEATFTLLFFEVRSPVESFLVGVGLVVEDFLSEAVAWVDPPLPMYVFLSYLARMNCSTALHS